MWSNPHPPSRTSPGDHFNNNSSATNPYSRNAAAPKGKPGRQSTDPWDWGWEDNSAHQDDWNNGWNQTPAPVPNVIPNAPPPFYHPSKPEKKAHGTPDLIPEKVTNISRGNMMPIRQQQHYNNQVSNPSEFFENIDLVAQNHQTTSLTPVFNSTAVRPPQQPNVPQNYHIYQPLPPQNIINKPPTPSSYFHQPPSSQPSNNESLSYYQQFPPTHPPSIFQNSQYYQPEHNNQMSTQEHNRNYFGQNQLSTQEHCNYYDQKTFNSGGPIFEPSVNLNTVEVENVEVAPPERTVTPNNHVDSSQGSLVQSSHEIISQGNNLSISNETNIPDNQETVPDNEEQLQGLQKKISKMKISSAQNLETWNSSGWENQEVAPRCELDRNQYLETGQLVDSSEAEEVPLETDTNDEGEALPPPGLHRMVTGQGTESISQRSVLGQPPSISQSNGSGFARLVTGQPTPSASPEPSGFERLVPGQHNNEEVLLNSSHRMVPGHQSQDLQLSQRFPTHQESQEELQRLVPGQTQNDPPIGVRMIPGQLSDDESNMNASELERMIPGGMSEHESSFPEDVPDDERMVPGGMSDDSRSQSISIDDDNRTSSERMIPGMTMQTEINPPQVDNQTERLVTGGGSIDVLDTSVTIGSQDGTRHVPVNRNGMSDSVNQPPPGLHRLVLGQINTECVADNGHAPAKAGERIEEKKPAGNPPPGMHRLVVGQFREKEPESETDKDKEVIKSNDRDDDSDSDYRLDRKRHRHRKDSYEEDRKERDYSSDREYRGKREDRREYRKKRDNSYNRSPEYRSDHEDYDYRDRRDRDRRDRPRDRRRRSPEYNYDSYYRDDPRKLLPRERDRRCYEPYDDDPYFYRENRSRPSSRSGSEYRRHRDYSSRQQYYTEQGGMNSYAHYYQMQQYYENMRRNDPQAYALWYERYMAEKFGSTSNDRASVHSGRSSANENSQLHENEEEERDGMKVEDTASHRSTPPLYSSAHIRGKFNMLGQLVVVNPHDPFSYGEHQATVTVCNVAGPNAADDPDMLEFLQNPGPFISGVTHKNTVLQYLKKQSDQFYHSSEKLLYELIRLVIKLNGVVDMTDVADLLIKSYRSSSSAEEIHFQEPSSERNGSPPLSSHQVTSKFRELLLEGNKNEALEWAMKNKDWGHALFLASKMDSKTHNNVMLRFANGLQSNDPLQTLYQLMSGREPQAATCAADKKWGDWRPHLAMMLSNRTANVELDRKAILTLGDSLSGRGRFFASHFCYLTAQLEFSNYTDRFHKLVLLGATPDKSFKQFATCRAIMLTLCYEYAKQLSNRDWCIQTLRPYKFILACHLFDHGNLTASLLYLESLAQEIVRLPGRDDKPLVQLVIDMADKIKCADSSLAFTSDSMNDPEWLVRLKNHAEETNDPNYLSPHLKHGISTSTMSDLEPHSGTEPVPQHEVQDVNQTYSHEVPSYISEPHSGIYAQDNYYDPTQNIYYNPAQVLRPSQDVQNLGYSTEQNAGANNSSMDYWPGNSSSGWDQQPVVPSAQEERPTETNPAESQPQISLKPNYGYFENCEENKKPQAGTQSAAPPPPDKPENRDKSSRRANKTQQNGSGWFGGIWDKLALRPKNQMKLPDDKNPPIVWDEKTKRWVNTDASEEEQTAQLKPPPKASELNGSVVPVVPSSAPATGVVSNTAVAPPVNLGLPPPSTTSTNKYKLQRGKGMRSNYVDVMGANTKSVSASANTQPYNVMPQAPVANFFVPAPVPGNENAPVDFLSPSGPVSYEPSSTKSDDQPPQGSGLRNAKSGTLKLLDFVVPQQFGQLPVS